jgi:SAM-dependent methyltransferase
MGQLTPAEIADQLWNAVAAVSAGSALEYGPVLVGLVAVARLSPGASDAIALGSGVPPGCPPSLLASLDELGLVRFLQRVDTPNRAALTRTLEDLQLPALSTPDILAVFDRLLVQRSASPTADPEHQTPTGINRLVARLATATQLDGESVVYDPACGSGGLLAALAKAAGGHRAVHGIELNPTAAALARVRGLLAGGDPWDVRTANTLTTDPHRGLQATHLASVPPFGLAWKDAAEAVEVNGTGRFRYGLPRRADATFLFLQDLLAKMRAPSAGGARAVILTHGAALWGGSKGESAVRQHLFESDLVEAIVVLPAGLFSHTAIQPYAWVLTNKKAEHFRGLVSLIDGSEFFVSTRRSRPSRSLETTQIDALVDLLGADESDIVRILPNDAFRREVDGAVTYAVERIEHLGFGLSRELVRLSEQYGTCDVRPLETVCVSITRVNPGRGAPPHDDPLCAIPLLRDIQIVADTSVLNADYLAMFFGTDLGQRLLAALGTGSTIPRVSPRDLGQLPVPVPTLDEQGSILETKARLDELSELLAHIEGELAANPRSVPEVNDRVVPMLQVLGRLSDADEVRERIRAGESKRVEFKETYSVDIRKGEKADYIELSALKTIVAFMNSDGGDLLIGVADNGDIPGISAEIERYYKADTDKFLLHIKNRLQKRIGEQFYPLIDQRLVSVQGTTVLWFACTASEQPVFLDDELFFVRTNPATDKLTGRRMHEYIRTRFE